MTTLFSNQKSKNFGSVFGYLNLRENLKLFHLQQFTFSHKSLVVAMLITPPPPPPHTPPSNITVRKEVILIAA